MYLGKPLALRISELLIKGGNQASKLYVVALSKKQKNVLIEC
uniref:Uncharacterized protein n=1 Tax=Arundo donax TaxID=35708 RepID=A0A0A8Z6V5_ARUDO